MGCEDKINPYDLERDPLRGKIGGEDWNYTAGNAQFNTFDNDITGLITAIDISDPCAIRISNDPHITLKFPAVRRNYTLPFINQNDGFVIFNLKGGTKKLTATSGFLEVVAITSTEVVGYISADFDEKNNVQGAFLLQICN